MCMHSHCMHFHGSQPTGKRKECEEQLIVCSLLEVEDGPFIYGILSHNKCYFLICIKRESLCHIHRMKKRTNSLRKDFFSLSRPLPCTRGAGLHGLGQWMPRLGLQWVWPVGSPGRRSERVKWCLFVSRISPCRCCCSFCISI
uniref:Uncharacterized protein n=1 Tax=Myotis myotis TaxID=51298 RepID=A0A7J7RSM6_MYOMY|nr:hypothetical protein mMyoMyo1_010191 [Myotis myotis]